MDFLEYHQLLGKFLDKFTAGDVRRYYIQRLRPHADDVEFTAPYCSTCDKASMCPHTPPLTVDHLRQHFDQKPWKPKNSKSGQYSCFALPGLFDGGKVKWFSADCDSTYAVEVVFDKLVPVLDSLGIEWIWENSGNEENVKGHLWFFVDCQLGELQDLMDLVFDVAGLANWHEMKRERKQRPKPERFDIEFYPTQKPNNAIRIPLGFHLRNGKVNAIEYKGRATRQAGKGMKWMMQCKQLSSDTVKEMIVTLTKKTGKKDKAIERSDRQAFKRGSHSRSFTYNALNLGVPKILGPAPPVFDALINNCQAIHYVADQIGKGALNNSGDDVHFVGLQWHNYATYNDIKIGGTSGEVFVEGHFESLTADKSSNNWELYKERLRPSRLAASCKTWEANLGMCGGCPFKGRPDFTNPIQFFTGDQIRRITLTKVKTTSLDEIRNVEFPKLRTLLLDEMDRTDLQAHMAKASIGRGKPKDTLIAHPMGSGKSQSIIGETAVQMARKHQNCMIAVPDARLAMEHKERIESMGNHAFVLMSFNNLFTYQNPGFNCPNDTDIKHLESLGIPSMVAKKRFCKKCPFREQCPYPNQYKDVLKEEHKIVIVQHAHFRVQEAFHRVLTKGYHALFVDENFTSNVFTRIVPSKEEIEVMKFLADKVDWLPKMIRWFEDGGMPNGRIILHEGDMEFLLAGFTHALVKWDMPEYVRAFNAGLYFDPDTQLDVFYPLPNMIPHRIFTDATPPLDMLKIILNNKKIRTMGHGHLINPKTYHPDNEVSQVLNASTSRASMETPGYLEALLRRIGTKAMDEYKGLKQLITVYKDLIPYTEKFLETNFPALAVGPGRQIQVNSMTLGTNAYEDVNVQWNLACVYLNAKAIAYEAYKLGTIQNYWADLEPEYCKRIENPFPLGIREDSSFEMESVPLERLELIGSNAYVTQYPDLTYRRPVDYRRELSRLLMVAKKQQNNRLRFKTGALRHFWEFDKQSTGLLTTRNFLLEDFLTSSIT